MPYTISLPSRTFKTLNGEFTITQEQHKEGTKIKSCFHISATGSQLEKDTDWMSEPLKDPISIIKKAMPSIIDSLPIIQFLDIDKDKIPVCSAYLLKDGKEIKHYLPITDTVERLKSLIARHDRTQLSDGEHVYDVSYKDIEALIID